EMPDPLIMRNGEKVKSVAQWRQRREEMKEILEFYELGHAPPPPGNVSGDELKSSEGLDGTARFRLGHLKFGPGQKLCVDVAIFRREGDGPFGTVVNPSFFGTPGTVSANVAAAQPAVTTNAAIRGKRPGFGAPLTPEAAAHNFETQLKRGYAL